MKNEKCKFQIEEAHYCAGLLRLGLPTIYNFHFAISTFQYRDTKPRVKSYIDTNT